MFAWFNDLLSSTSEFMPHGACYLWLPSILWLHVVADSIIAIAYYSIPFALFYFVKKRTDLAYRWVVVLFAVFICLCGTTHLISIWTIWHPDYWLDGLIKLATALVSIVTAILIWLLIPELLKLPSPQTLQNSENYLRAVFNATPDAMLINDEQGIITMVNLQTEQLLGYRADELIGQAIEILIPASYRATDSKTQTRFAASSFAPLLENGRETKVLCKNGTELDVEISLSPIKTALGLVFATALRDITARLEAEAKLRNSEQRFRRMADSAPVMIWMTDVTGEPSFANQTWLNFIGFDSTQAVSHTHWKSLIHPEDWKKTFSDYYSNTENRSTISTEYRLRNAQGDWRWVLDNGVSLHDENGVFTGYIGSAIDITEHKHLEIQKERFFKFFNLARDLQCIIDLEGRFQQINPAFSRTLGFSMDEILQKTFIEFVIPEDQAKSLEEAKKLQRVEVDVLLDFENRYRCKDGSLCWLSWKAVFDPTEHLLYAVARNVTEAKKNEEKLQLAEMVYQHSIEAILITDANNKIIAANPAFSKISGYAIEDVLGKNPSMFQSGKHDRNFYRIMWQAINTKGHWQGEIWDRRKNGQLYAKFLSICSILNAEEQLQCYLALFSDITDQKLYEEEIKRLSESELNKAKLEAERASQAKSDFLASMSHELFTPMNAVLGFAQLLECEDLTEEQQLYVSSILEGAHHLLDLIKEVLAFSIIESEQLTLNLEKLELTALLESCITVMSSLASDKGIKIIDNLTPACVVSVMADSLRLKQVLLNLISNAVKYNRVNGTITLSCEQVGTQTLRINVIDTGGGLSEQQLAKLFQPFERLSAKNSAIEGAGLGLCISKKLIEAMNGAIGASSNNDKGCCFWIEIPLSEPFYSTEYIYHI